MYKSSIYLTIPASSLVGLTHTHTAIMMNSSSVGLWCNPPPPGTDEDISNSSFKSEKRNTPERAIDRIDPFLKSAEYLKYEKKLNSDHSRRRSRSRSRHRRRRSRSRSKGRHRHRRRRYSSSRSRSRSRSKRRHKRNRHSRSHSRSRSQSKSHRSHRSRHRRSRSPRASHSRVKLELDLDEKKIKTEEDVEEEEEDDAANENAFKNDGTFMEMFKKMQEEQKQKTEAEKPSTSTETKTLLPAFGKRRGGKVLKTGLVQKMKTKEQEEAEAQDAWTLYMKEVKRYKEACCDDDSKTRLLVK